MSNRHGLVLLERLENRYSKDSAEMTMADWIAANTTLRNKPFSYDRYPFQRQIASDMHPNMDCEKCSQVGLTEIQIRKTLGFLVRNQGTTAIMTFPDIAMFEKNSRTRIQPLVKKDKVFNTEMDEKAIRSKPLMQFGTSFLHVTAANESDATSTPADMVMNDEVDLTDPAMLALFNSRMQNSDWRINQRFSTPTHVGFGIDLGYQASDQHEFMVKCDACNHWQIPLFTRDFVEIPGLPDDIGNLADIDVSIIDQIDLANACYVCERCRAPLDLGRDDNREWVPRYPNRTHARGYRVRPSCTSRLSPQYIIEQLLKYKERDYVRGWYNTVLGEAFTPGNARLNKAEIDACFTGQMSMPAPNNDLPHFIGIDMGQICTIVLGRGPTQETCKPILFETVHVDNLLQRIKELRAQFRIVSGACDRQPYEPTADAVFKESDGIIMPVEYRGTQEVRLVKNALDEITHAQAERTKLLDTVVRHIRARNCMMSGYGNLRTVITEHLMDMVRDEKPEEPAKWVKLTGNDHFFHAMGYMYFSYKIREVLDAQLEEDIRTTVFVGTVTMGALNENMLGVKDKSLERPVHVL